MKKKQIIQTKNKKKKKRRKKTSQIDLASCEKKKDRGANKNSGYPIQEENKYRQNKYSQIIKE